MENQAKTNEAAAVKNDDSWRAVLPLSRVKRIIRTPQLLGMGVDDPDDEEEIKNVSNEAVFLMAKATVRPSPLVLS